MVPGPVLLDAQWPEVRSSAPRNTDGSVNLDAPTPMLVDGKMPDFSGVWRPVSVPCVDNDPEADPFGFAFGCTDQNFGTPIGVTDFTAELPEHMEVGAYELPYQPWAKELAEERTAQLGKGDPGSYCLPMSVPVSWADFVYSKIVHTENVLVMLSEYMAQYRQIFLDGRPLPEDPFPMFKGYSVGHWEDDTLVVETVGIKEGGWIDIKGNPLTNQARLTERIRRPSFGALEVEITIDDPGAYTEPFSATRRLIYVPDLELLDYICNENEKDLEHMVGASAEP